MTYFIKTNNTFNVADERALDIHKLLPVGNYVVNYNSMKDEYSLEGIDDFKLPTKVYGKSNGHCDRIIRSFNDRPGATGVLLSGEKGSGKTLLTKSLSIELKKQDVPTIVINSPFCGDTFNKFIQTILQPCIILFDEFEKTYGSDDQQKILTLLDGVFPTKKLFLLTINDGYIDPHMRNRPGRIYYQITYKGIEEEFIREYCNDNLKNLSHLDKFVQIAGCFSAFNFDMLKSVVEEMNRFDEGPAEAMAILNSRLEHDYCKVGYDVTAVFNGRKLSRDEYTPVQLDVNILASSGNHRVDIWGDVTVCAGNPELEKTMDDFPPLVFNASSIKSVMQNGDIICQQKDDKGNVLDVIVSKRPENKAFNFNSF